MLMMSDMKRFEVKLDRVGNEMIFKMKEELDRRDIGGGMHHAIQIQEKIRAVREDLSHMRTAFSIDGEGGGNNVRSDPEGSRRTTALYAYDG